MKVAITCDSILKRGHETALIETLLGLYPMAEIYTLAHSPTLVVGPIQSHKIHSSFLSHFVKTPEDLKKWTWLVPSAAKNLEIPCSFDLVIDVSSGFSHGINRCQKSQSVTYFYGFDSLVNQGINKIFAPMIERWCQAELKKRNNIIFSSKALSGHLGVEKWMENTQFISPYFDVHEFPLVQDQKPFLPGFSHFLAIHTLGLTSAMATQLAQGLLKTNQSFCFVGPDEHLFSAKKKLGENSFFGERCDGELAPFLASAKAAIDFSLSSFPLFALKNLALGRPVIVLDNEINRQFFKNEGPQFVNPKEFIKNLSIDQHLFEMNGEKIRANALRFSPLRFRSEMIRYLNSKIQEHESKNMNSR